MFTQKVHKINFLKLSVSVVLTFFFTFNAWNGLIKPPDSLHHSGFTPFRTSSYVYINTPERPTINSWIQILNCSKFHFYNNYFYELVQKRLLNQIIASSQKFDFALIVIKPPGSYNYFSKRERDEDPVLG